MTPVTPSSVCTHELKTDPAVFEAVWTGVKTFEIRKNDRDFKVGDSLCLMETVHSGNDMKHAGMPLLYTDRTMVKVVSHVLTGYGLMEGWCCLSFAPALAERTQQEAQEYRAALAELLDSWMTAFPSSDKGQEAQDAWADRRALARNHAQTLLDRPTSAANSTAPMQPSDEHRLDKIMRVCMNIANRYAFVGDAAFPRGRERLRAALAAPTQAAGGEVECLRRSQSEAVMPLIGLLLDAWDGMHNDTKGAIKEDAPELAKQLSLIGQSMEGAAPAAQEAGGEAVITEAEAAKSGERLVWLRERLDTPEKRRNWRAAQAAQPVPKPCKTIADCTTPTLCLSVGTCKGYHVMPASVRASAAPATAVGPNLPDPLGCRACTHPDCGRFNGPRQVECRAMLDSACARHSAAAAPEGLTYERITKHTLLAKDCPPDSKVMLVSSLRRILATRPTAAQPSEPFPGMSEAFEAHFAQSWIDRSWRAEASTWAAAWKSATRAAALATPDAAEARKAVKELRAHLAAIAVVGQIDGHDVIRRLSVLDMADRGIGDQP